MIYRVAMELEIVAVCMSLVAVALVMYIFWLCIAAYIETSTAPKADFFTCDKHGAFPTKYLMELPLNDGGAPVKQCPLCFEESMKRADSFLKAKEKTNGVK